MNQIEQKKPVMIALTGGRSTPVILGVLAVRPQAVEFLNSLDETEREQDIRTALSSMTDLETTEPGLNVNAFDMQAAYVACQQLADRHTSDEVVINLSGGTKVMALGAYAFAKERQIPALYVNTNNRQVLDLTTNRPFPMPPLSVEAYLACFGRSPNRTFNAQTLSIPLDDARRLSVDLVRMGAPALAVLERIRIQDKGKGRRTLMIKDYHPSAEEKEVWAALIKAGILAEVTDIARDFRFTIPLDGDASFLKGQWLEIFVWDQAERQRDKDGERVFDDTSFGFEIPSDATGARKEIDGGFMIGGQMIHCSCKSGSTKIWSTDYLDELRSVSSLIGGRFCSRIFITTGIPPSGGESGFIDYQRFINQAKDREIVVITGEQLHNVGQLLAKEAVKPTFWRV